MPLIPAEREQVEAQIFTLLAMARDLARSLGDEEWSRVIDHARYTQTLEEDSHES